MRQNPKHATESFPDYQMPTQQEVLKGYLQFQKLNQAFLTGMYVEARIQRFRFCPSKSPMEWRYRCYLQQYATMHATI